MLHLKKAIWLLVLVRIRPPPESLGLNDFNKKKFNKMVNHVLRWLCYADKEEIDLPAMGQQNDTLSLEWLKRIHIDTLLILNETCPDPLTLEGSTIKCSTLYF